MIRSAEPSDLSVLEGLIGRAMAHPWSKGQIGAALEGSLARTRLIFGPSGESGPPAGFLLARRISDQLEIDLVGVDPTHRRSGLARRLLEDLIEAEERSGALEARLELAISNVPARALYEGLGFVVVGRRSRYYPDGDDALLLTRSLG